MVVAWIKMREILGSSERSLNLIYYYIIGAPSPASSSSTALSALTSQVNLIPVQQNTQQQQQQQFGQQILQFSPQTPQPAKPSTRRRSSGQPPGVGGKKRPNSANK